jgi:chromosomal replication initiator protein
MRSAQEIWEAALGELQLQVNKPNYQTWFQGTKGIAYQDGQFFIGVPSTFIAEYLDKNQRSLIEKTLTGLVQSKINVHFQVSSAQQDSPDDYICQETSATDLPRFNPKYTFESFVVGSSNRLAHAAALGVAQNPGHGYNPLFIYGGAGLGKTHLLQAIGHIAQANNVRVLYVSGEKFTIDFINAIRQQKTDEFRSKYRGVDMLMIDDIHFISGKEQTAESFFHTFNELHNSSRQIVITSDRSPKSMPLLEDRLCSRFEWGLIVDIKPPDLETRLAILRSKTEQAGANILPDVLELIAQQVRKNIRELEGSLNRIIAYARLVRAEVTPELASRALADIASKASQDGHITPAKLLDAVAESFQLTPEVLTSRRREKEIALARQVAMYILKQQGSYSLNEIGNILGGRNPSTVSHACEKVALNIEASPLLRRQVKDIQTRMDVKPKKKPF